MGSNSGCIRTMNTKGHSAGGNVGHIGGGDIGLDCNDQDTGYSQLGPRGRMYLIMTFRGQYYSLQADSSMS